VTAGAASGARPPRPLSSSCDHQARPAGRAPYRGWSGRVPAGRGTMRPDPSAHRAALDARHGLPWHQRPPFDCCVQQPGRITAAAPLFPLLRPSVTSLSRQRDASLTSGGCGLRKSRHCTIYSCRKIGGKLGQGGSEPRGVVLRDRFGHAVSFRSRLQRRGRPPPGSLQSPHSLRPSVTNCAATAASTPEARTVKPAVRNTVCKVVDETRIAPRPDPAARAI
jgi:hypothetical protein